jgi:hypothetical protein
MGLNPMIRNQTITRMKKSSGITSRIDMEKIKTSEYRNLGSPVFEAMIFEMFEIFPKIEESSVFSTTAINAVTNVVIENPITDHFDNWTRIWDDPLGQTLTAIIAEKAATLYDMASFGVTKNGVSIKLLNKRAAKPE